MGYKNYRAITKEQHDDFLNKGFIVLKKALPRELAHQWTEESWDRLQYDPKDRTTWKQSRIHLPVTKSIDVPSEYPFIWDVICDLCGGEDRIHPWRPGNGFIINFNEGAGSEWMPPGRTATGWHKDGDFFRHFLDSPEQGLLTLILWSDIEHKGGATFVASDSVGVVSRYLSDHPEGVHPLEFPVQEMINQCNDFLECTGSAGDVVLLHPYMLHAGSYNHSQRVRFLTNPPVSLKEPMQFDRQNPDEYSLIELAVLRGLGVDRYKFSPTAERERIIPERERQHQKMLLEEAARSGG